jgi:hypothetical protein
VTGGVQPKLIAEQGQVEAGHLACIDGRWWEYLRMPRIRIAAYSVSSTSR